MREAVIAFAALAVLMVGAQLLRRRKATVAPAAAPRIDGRLVLQPRRRNAVMLGLTALIPAALLAALTFRAWARGQTGTAGLLGGLVATLVPVAVAAWQFTAAARARIVVHETGLEQFGPFRRRLVGWGSVAKVGFNPAQHWFFVTVQDGSHLWLPADVPGMGEFAAIALRRLPPAVLQDPMVREVLEELAETSTQSPSPPAAGGGRGSG